MNAWQIAALMNMTTRRVVAGGGDDQDEGYKQLNAIAKMMLIFFCIMGIAMVVVIVMAIFFPFTPVDTSLKVTGLDGNAVMVTKGIVDYTPWNFTKNKREVDNKVSELKGNLEKLGRHPRTTDESVKNQVRVRLEW